MYEHERVSFGAVGICLCSFMSACPFMYVHAALSGCVNACVCMHVLFKSIGVRLRVSYMCLYVLNLSGPRLPEAGFYCTRLTVKQNPWEN